jgi:hypothetical protein
LRARKSAFRTTDRANPPAITFFGLHFIAIGYLLLNFEFARISELFGPIFGRIDDEITTIARRIDLSRGTEEAIESLIFALAISGPLLILAWIGRLIAKKWAAKVPRKRFLALIGLISLSFAGIALAIVATTRPFRDRNHQVELVFRVVDQNSRKPLEGVHLAIVNPFEVFDPDAPSDNATTTRSGLDGLARLTCSFEAEGERNAFHSIGTFSPWGRWLELSATGYQTVRIPLTNVLGPEVDVDQIKLPEVTLIPGKTPEDAFQDVAKTYHTNFGMGGASFRIQNDGRFTFDASSCTSSYSEYGSLKRVGDEIELQSIPRPGTEPFWMMTFRYRIIQWGDCRYLSRTDNSEIRRFCQGGLRPFGRRMPGESYGGYVRSGDEKKKPVGWPSLPLGAWVDFVAYQVGFDPNKSRVQNALTTIGVLMSRIKRVSRDSADLNSLF